MNNNWIELLQKQNQLEKVIESNQVTEKFGLTLNIQDAELILEERINTLREQRRIEFVSSVVTKIIYEFCDSVYINQNNYVDTIIKLQEIFFLFKNEMLDEITDDELLHLMKEQFENICFGDLEYLEGTCLSNFAQAIRSGYQAYKKSDGYGEYSKFDTVQRWDYDLYIEVLKELTWR